MTAGARLRRKNGEKSVRLVKAVGERFQPVDLLADGFRDSRRPPLLASTAAGRQEPDHALLPKTASQGAHRIGSCTSARRIIFRDLSRPVTTVEISRATALQPCLQHPMRASCAACEQTSATQHHDAHTVPVPRPPGAGATAAPERATPLAVTRPAQ